MLVSPFKLTLKRNLCAAAELLYQQNKVPAILIDLNVYNKRFKEFPFDSTEYTNLTSYKEYYTIDEHTIIDNVFFSLKDYLGELTCVHPVKFHMNIAANAETNVEPQHRMLKEVTLNFCVDFYTSNKTIRMVTEGFSTFQGLGSSSLFKTEN